MIKEYLAYLKDNPKGYWFKRKLYGWGWTPVTWQGWACIIGYILIVVLLSSTVGDAPTTTEMIGMFILPLSILTGILIWICYEKGEPPRWQWGKPKK